mmetsp:Transcript_56571/g.111762  ORF Transcript_56571/g.111762 Transcript_56571/m.111762 type:complete len:251 (+) Transcript_56571:138-890(+)
MISKQPCNWRSLLTPTPLVAGIIALRFTFFFLEGAQERRVSKCTNAKRKKTGRVRAGKRKKGTRAKDAPSGNRTRGGLFSRCQLCFRLLCPLAHDAVEDGAEHHGGAAVRAEGDVVAEQHRAQHHADHLPRRHDDGEYHGAERLDGVEDEHLPGSGSDGRDDLVPHRLRVRTQVLHHRGELVLQHQGAHGDDDRGAVHAEHHLVRGRLVVLVDAVLPLARKGVRADVESEAHEPKHLRLLFTCCVWRFVL